MITTNLEFNRRPGHDKRHEIRPPEPLDKKKAPPIGDPDSDPKDQKEIRFPRKDKRKDNDEKDVPDKND